MLLKGFVLKFPDWYDFPFSFYSLIPMGNQGKWPCQKQMTFNPQQLRLLLYNLDFRKEKGAPWASFLILLSGGLPLVQFFHITDS